MYEESHSLMDGKVHVYKRGRSRFWQCSTYMNGLNHRKSTKHESLAMAMDYWIDFLKEITTSPACLV